MLPWLPCSYHGYHVAMVLYYLALAIERVYIVHDLYTVLLEYIVIFLKCPGGITRCHGYHSYHSYFIIVTMVTVTSYFNIVFRDLLICFWGKYGNDPKDLLPYRYRSYHIYGNYGNVALCYHDGNGNTLLRTF